GLSPERHDFLSGCLGYPGTGLAGQFSDCRHEDGPLGLQGRESLRCDQDQCGVPGQAGSARRQFGAAFGQVRLAHLFLRTSATMLGQFMWMAFSALMGAIMISLGIALEWRDWLPYLVILPMLIAVGGFVAGYRGFIRYWRARPEDLLYQR